MRLTTVIVFTVLLINVQFTSCTINWLPRRLVDTVSNKTYEIKNYVRDTGRSLKRFYVEKVRNSFNSIFNGTARDKMAKPGEERYNQKFKAYLEAAEMSATKIFDAIAPDVKFKCADNPTNQMTTPQLIASNGYSAESHTIVTADGYLLTVHRIPYSRNSSKDIIPRKTALLHHGLLGSSADWVIPGPDKGLAYVLADAGYDVWLANVRGNTYSRAHRVFPVDSFAFWNFTFHEVSQHDLPAVIDYIIAVKGLDVKINYIGHSMGTTVLFALLSTKTEYNKVLRAGFALAPVAYMSDIRSPIKLLARFSNHIEILMKLLGANEFLPQNAVLRWLSRHMCEFNNYEAAICENSMFVLCGHDEKQFNKTLLPIILGHVPAGASTKTLIHYAQEIYAGGAFQQFDFGPDGNIRQYGTPTPPKYQLDKVTLPIALLSAENDWLASESAVRSLYAQLAKPIEHYIVPLKEFNHIDFLWAIDAPKLVYKKLLTLMEESVFVTYKNTVLDDYQTSTGRAGSTITNYMPFITTADDNNINVNFV